MKGARDLKGAPDKKKKKKERDLAASRQKSQADSRRHIGIAQEELEQWGKLKHESRTGENRVKNEYPLSKEKETTTR